MFKGSELFFNKILDPQNTAGWRMEREMPQNYIGEECEYDTESHGLRENMDVR